MKTGIMHRAVQIGLAGILGLVAQTALSNTFYVSPNGSHTSPFDTWEKAATNIQAATALAVAYDQVLVTNGIYSITRQIMLTSGFTLKSVNGAAVTIIQANRQTRCLFLSASNAMVNGFTLTGGNAGSAGYDEYPNYGGGAYIYRHGELYNCIITNNTAGAGQSSIGGGVYLYLGGTVTNCMVATNHAAYCGAGAAIFGGGAMRNCVISNNVASGSYSPSSAGVHMQSFGGVGGSVENSVIVNNLATGTGDAGGVYMDAGNTLDRCVVSGNRSYRNGGGVMFVFGGTARNCLIADNTAGSWAGGAFISGGGTIQNCTIAGNRAAWGGGMYLIFNGTIQNSIFSGNTATMTSGGNNYYMDSGSGQATYSCAQPAFAGTGNISGDPLFANAAAGDFRLQASSPCIDTGTNQVWMQASKDLDAKTRIINNVVDMGAYEYGVDPNQGATNFYVYILQPMDDNEFKAPAEIYCDMHAYVFGARTITQTVIFANSEPVLVSPTNGVTWVFKFWTWTNVPIGNYTMTFGAWNDLGQSAFSTPVSVRVYPDEDVMMESRILQPMEGQQFAAPEDIFINAQASLFSTNASIAITQTVIFANSIPILVSPTSGVASALTFWSWTNAAPGEYELTYVAQANGGYAVTSTPVNVAVIVTNVQYAAGDFDRDGKDDPIAADANGGWHIWFSSQQFARSPTVFIGYRGKPMTGDFDRDGKDDAIVVDMNNGNWWIWFSGAGYEKSAIPYLGYPGLPAVGDFDRDHLDDAIVADANGAWSIWFSAQGYALSPTTYIGFPGTPASGDFDRDGFDDAVVVDEATGNWYVWYSSHGYGERSAPLIGVPGTPVAGDFDGDRFSDAAVVDNFGDWYIWLSGQGYSMVGPYQFNPYAP